MKLILNQLESSLQSKNYYLSLFMALTIPDICGAMDAEDGIASGARYRAWYEKWARPRFWDQLKASVPGIEAYYPTPLENPFDGDNCYYFRCSLLHQGRGQHPKSKFERILFFEPGSSMVGHYCEADRALIIDINLFCSEIIAGARLWLDAVEHTDRFVQNYNLFARRHENGLLPYAQGFPVIG